VALVCALALAAAAMALSGNTRSEFWWNDEGRHAMDGVFVLDFVRDLPASLDVYRYATEYYARYPCLGLVQYPPVFSVVEAAFFALFGVHLMVARATVAAFGALGAVFGYKLAREFLGVAASAAFALLVFAAPDVVYWSRGVMLETPDVAVMLLASWVFVRYVEERRLRLGLLAGLLLAAAVLTKQTACVLGPVWALYAVWRRGWRIVWNRATGWAVGLLGVFLVPYMVMTVKFSPVNLGQSVGDLSGGLANSRTSWRGIRFYLASAPAQVGWLCLALAVVAIVVAVGRRAKQGRACGDEGLRCAMVLALSWVAVCYVMLTFVVAHKDRRFIIVWVPGLALLAAVAVEWLWRLRGLGRGAATLALACAVGQAGLLGAGAPMGPARNEAPYVRGLEPLAERLADAAEPGTVVFFAGFFNGNFVFHMREHDAGRHVVVLRGTKLLVALMAEKEHGMQVLVETGEEILDVFRRYGVRYVAVEDPSPKLLALAPVFGELRALLRTERFAAVGVFPIATNLRNAAPKVTLYEFLEAGPARSEALEIEIPAAGRRIRVPLRRLGVPTAASVRDDEAL
jgi:hypothetical protein